MRGGCQHRPKYGWQQTEEPLLQGSMDGKDEFYFYNGPKGRPLALPELPD